MAGDVRTAIESWPRRDRALLTILAFALFLRIAIACWMVVAHPDEVWQYLEPAHHLSAGSWIQTWEARAGARSWLLPMLLAGPMAIGQAIAPTSMLNIILPRIVCALLSFGAIFGAAGLGFRLSRLHGLMAAFVISFWYEIPYFAPRTLSEPVATACFIAAAWFLLGDRTERRTAIGGLLLGLCCVVRFQYGPAALVLAMFTAGLRWRDWVALALGGVIALAISGASELAAGGIPFGWIVENFRLNIVENRSADYGVSPIYGGVALIWNLWGWATPPLLLLAIVGARRYPALFVAAMINLAVHSLVPHKEYRFLLLTTSILVLLGAIGSVDLLQRFTAASRAAAIKTGAVWICLSIACAALGSSAREWGQNAQLFGGWHIARAVPGVCGIAMYKPANNLAASYALYGWNTQIYQFGVGKETRAAAINAAPTTRAHSSRAFNMVITPVDHIPEFPGYRTIGCGRRTGGNLCVLTRPGGCTVSEADRPFEINRVLAREGV